MWFRYVLKCSSTVLKMINRVKNAFELKRDKFLPTVNKIFSNARYFGVSKYGWNLPFCFTIIFFLMLFSLESYAVWKLVRLLTNNHDEGGMVGRFSGSIFYGNALLSLWLSSRFITSWQNLSQLWLSTEIATRIPIPIDDTIRAKCLFVSTVVAVCAIVEHMLSMMSATGFDIPYEEYFERYIFSSHGFLIDKDDYNLFTAIPVFILSKLATALWNYQDLIIILISMGLTSRYQRLNRYVGSIVETEIKLQKFGTDLYINTLLWRHVREAYGRQASLVRTLDKKLGPLVLLSNINNLYFILLQLYLGINKDTGNAINRAYYLMSLGWLLVRACAVVLAAANIQVQSKQALAYLNSCCNSDYNIEVKRLKYRLSKESIGLSGMGLFYLDRELLLEVAAAIVKYELVLVQYDS